MIHSGLHQFMITDLLHSAQATVSFALYLFFPGYVIGWATGLFSFRNKSASERLLLSIVLSSAVVPVLAVLIGRFVSTAASQWCFIALAVAGAFQIATKAVRNRENFELKRSTWIALAMAAIWACVALFELADLQIGQRLYLSVTAYDHCIRTELVQAVLRTGVPPHNPLFYASGQAPVMRYYYYWYVLCALPSQLFGISARASLSASSVWCGFALAALIPLYLKHFFHESNGLRKKSLLGIALLGVTGLDLIPNLLWFAQNRSVVYADMDWWDPNQVTSWIGSLLWVPHHVAALVACMAGFLVLSQMKNGTRFRERVVTALVAGASFAGAAGLSIYVTFTFALFVIAWTLYLPVQRRFADCATYIASGAISMLLSFPYLRDLHGVGGIKASFAFFAIRDFPTALDWLRRHNVTDPRLLTLSSLPTLPVVYAIEFGFFLLVGILRFKSELRGPLRLTLNQRAAWCILGVSLLVGTFLHSGVIVSNDLGMRSVLPAQFILLLWAASLLANQFAESASPANSSRRAIRILITTTLAFGILGTVAELFILRAYAPLADSETIERSEDFMPAVPHMGERTYALRTGYGQLNAMLAPGAIIQPNPIATSYLPLLLYSNHQAAAHGRDCGVGFGGDPLQCEKIIVPLANLYLTQHPIRGSDVDALCNALSINVLVATDADQVWHDANGWVWQRNALVANPYMRAIPCGRLASR